MDCEADTTLHFSALSWWRLKGRGWVATVECDRERPRDHPGLDGTTVVIDGELFHCLGVERKMPGFPIQKGEHIGLLVVET